MRTTFKRLQALVAEYPRLAITGAPKTGKTTLAQRLGGGRTVVHADDFIGQDWSQASARLAAHAGSVSGPMVVEGVAVPRALRKGLKVDAVLLLDKPHVELKAGQMAMGKGVRTVLNEWRQANAGVPVFQWEEED